MTKIAIIGAQGMLGSAVCRYLSEKKYQVLEINSSRKTQSSNLVAQFDIVNDSLEKLEKILTDVSFVINCAGLIRHKIDENSIESLNSLIKINSLFPIQLTTLSHKMNFKVIQIATDCVYSGQEGNYSESDIRVPNDYYGYSKALGEHIHHNLITLRCSLVGRELNSKVEFMEWVLNHGEGSVINGFTDHVWNGLTTLHFAKIVSGIIETSEFKDGTFHLVPSDSVSKFELAKLIVENFAISGVKIAQSKSYGAVNRILITNYKEFNSDMWRDAGYNKPLTIAEMIKEYSLWV